MSIRICNPTNKEEPTPALPKGGGNVTSPGQFVPPDMHIRLNKVGKYE